jgi:voltage-gated potassium channel
MLDDSWGDAFYRAVVTSSLTGLDDRPEGSGAELVTVLLVLSGIAIFAYVGSIIVEAIARGVIGGAWAERRRRRAIAELRDHYIICGYGRVGRRVAAEFREWRVPYVVLDNNPDAITTADERGELFIEGNGTRDEDLESAGLSRARGLVVSSDSDADNLYITLSARVAQPSLLIVARASDADAARKLKLAGADRVVQPYSAAGREMAQLVVKPQVAAFLEVVSTAAGPEFRFEEIEVTEDCGQDGRTIGQLDIQKRTGALVIALRKADGSFDTTPGPEAVVATGDVLIAVGTPEELRRLEDIFAPRDAVAP